MNVGVVVSHAHTHTHTHTHARTHTHTLPDVTAGPDTAETIQSEIVINGIRISHSLVPLRDFKMCESTNLSDLVTGGFPPRS
jgi:hypothetical protein